MRQDTLKIIYEQMDLLEKIFQNGLRIIQQQRMLVASLHPESVPDSNAAHALSESPSLAQIITHKIINTFFSSQCIASGEGTLMTHESLPLFETDLLGLSVKRVKSSPAGFYQNADTNALQFLLKTKESHYIIDSLDKTPVIYSVTYRDTRDIVEALTEDASIKTHEPKIVQGFVELIQTLKFE